MKLIYGTLCDYAGPGANGKLIIVGAYDTVTDNAHLRPIPFPPSYLLAIFEAHLAEGSPIPLSIKFQNQEGKDILAAPISLPINFAMQGKGRPTRGTLIINLPQFKVPEQDTYAFEFFARDNHIGSVQVYVQEPPPAA